MDNWLINVLALVLLAVVLDGARRAYLKHRDSMKVSRNLADSMRGGLDERDFDDLQSDRPVAADWSESSDAPRARDALLDSELEYIDPEEAERRRQVAAELPGTVRVVQRRKPEDASQVNRKVQQSFQSSRRPLAGSRPERPLSTPPMAELAGQDERQNTVESAFESELETAGEAVQEPVSRQPLQTSLNLEEQVPTLMDSVMDTELEPVAEKEHAVSAEPVSQSAASVPQAESSADLSGEPEFTSARREPSLDESVSLETLQKVDEESEAAEAARVSTAREEAESRRKPAWASADIRFPELKKASPFARRESSAKAGSKGRGAATQESGAATKQRAVEEVLILNIMARPGDRFEGNDLLRVLLSAGLRFGDMNIFHYHCGEAGEGPVLFSLANVVVPGTFDMSAMEEFTSPGVSLFLALPAEVEALKALDTLLATARHIAEQLGGELKDENRSVFTPQTAEHYRQRVMEFQRRKALAQAQG